MDVNFRLVRGNELQARLQDVPVNLKDALRAYFVELAPTIVNNITANMPVRSGRMVGSTRATVTETGDHVGIRITNNAPYFGILDRGGTIPPHAIMPLSAKAVAFELMQGSSSPTGDLWAFSHVMHPGATIQGKRYVQRGLLNSVPEIANAVKAAVRLTLAGSA